MKGNKIKIIHSMGRDMNELFEVVAKWIPVYAFSMDEPYYYPKLKDDIFQLNRNPKTDFSFFV